MQAGILLEEYKLQKGSKGAWGILLDIVSAFGLGFVLKMQFFSIGSTKQQCNMIEIITADMTKLEMDAIVNAANCSLPGSGLNLSKE